MKMDIVVEILQGRIEWRKW